MTHTLTSLIYWVIISNCTLSEIPYNWVLNVKYDQKLVFKRNGTKDNFFNVRLDLIGKIVQRMWPFYTISLSQISQNQFLNTVQYKS